MILRKIIKKSLLVTAAFATFLCAFAMSSNASSVAPRSISTELSKAIMESARGMANAYVCYDDDLGQQFLGTRIKDLHRELLLGIPSTMLKKPTDYTASNVKGIMDLAIHHKYAILFDGKISNFTDYYRKKLIKTLSKNNNNNQDFTSKIPTNGRQASIYLLSELGKTTSQEIVDNNPNYDFSKNSGTKPEDKLGELLKTLEVNNIVTRIFKEENIKDYLMPENLTALTGTMTSIRDYLGSSSKPDFSPILNYHYQSALTTLSSPQFSDAYLGDSKFAQSAQPFRLAVACYNNYAKENYQFLLQKSYLISAATDIIQRGAVGGVDENTKMTRGELQIAREILWENWNIQKYSPAMKKESSQELLTGLLSKMRYTGKGDHSDRCVLLTLAYTCCPPKGVISSCIEDQIQWEMNVMHQANPNSCPSVKMVKEYANFCEGYIKG